MPLGKREWAHAETEEVQVGHQEKSPLRMSGEALA